MTRRSQELHETPAGCNLTMTTTKLQHRLYFQFSEGSERSGVEKLRGATATDWSYLFNRHVTNNYMLCYNTLQSAIGYRLACRIEFVDYTLSRWSFVDVSRDLSFSNGRSRNVTFDSSHSFPEFWWKNCDFCHCYFIHSYCHIFLSLDNADFFYQIACLRLLATLSYRKDFRLYVNLLIYTQSNIILKGLCTTMIILTNIFFTFFRFSCISHIN